MSPMAIMSSAYWETPWGLVSRILVAIGILTQICRALQMVSKLEDRRPSPDGLAFFCSSIGGTFI